MSLPGFQHLILKTPASAATSYQQYCLMISSQCLGVSGTFPAHEKKWAQLVLHTSYHQWQPWLKTHQVRRYTIVVVHDEYNGQELMFQTSNKGEAVDRFTISREYLFILGHCLCQPPPSLSIQQHQYAKGSLIKTVYNIFLWKKIWNLCLLFPWALSCFYLDYTAVLQPNKPHEKKWWAKTQHIVPGDCRDKLAPMLLLQTHCCFIESVWYELHTKGFADHVETMWIPVRIFLQINIYSSLPPFLLFIPANITPHRSCSALFVLAVTRERLGKLRVSGWCQHTM